MRPQRILIVEDDAATARRYEAALDRSQYNHVHALSVRAAEELFEAYDPDLVILDIQLGAGEDGWSWGQRLRAQSQVLVIVVTGTRTSEQDKQMGLEWADAYFSKPVDPVTLAANVNALFRRSGEPVQRQATTYRYEFGLEIDGVSRIARMPKLPPATFGQEQMEVLACLLMKSGEVATLSELYLAKEGKRLAYGDLPAARSIIDNVIAQLRGKFELLTPIPLIKNHRGVGYSLRAPDEAWP